MWKRSENWSFDTPEEFTGWLISGHWFAGQLDAGDTFHWREPADSGRFGFWEDDRGSFHDRSGGRALGHRVDLEGVDVFYDAVQDAVPILTPMIISTVAMRNNYK